MVSVQLLMTTAELGSAWGAAATAPARAAMVAMENFILIRLLRCTINRGEY